MRRQLLVATALTTTIIYLVPGAAMAQVAIHDWSGFYIGANIGGAAGNAHFDFDYEDSSDSPERLEIPTLGLSGTLTAGFNLQQGNFVYGVAADGTLLTLGGDLQSPDSDPFYDVDTRLDALLSLRGRLGLTSGPVLYYATAGIAAGKVSFTTDVVDGGILDSIPSPATGSGIVFGPTIGAGVEFALNDAVSLNMEGIVTDLGPLTATGDNGKGPYSVDSRMRTLNLRTGVNVHF
jgi:outer membrane immunogenic protein